MSICAPSARRAGDIVKPLADAHLCKADDLTPNRAMVAAIRRAMDIASHWPGQPPAGAGHDPALPR